MPDVFRAAMSELLDARLSEMAASMTASLATAMSAAVASIVAAQLPSIPATPQPLSSTMAAGLGSEQLPVSATLPSPGGPSRHTPIPAYVSPNNSASTSYATALRSEVDILGARLEMLCLAKGYKPPPGGFTSSMEAYDRNTSYILRQQLDIVDEVQRLSDHRSRYMEDNRTCQEIEIQGAIDRLAQLRADHSAMNLLNDEEYDQLELTASNDRDFQCRSALHNIPDKPAWLVEQHVPTVCRGVLDEISSLGFFLTSDLQVWNLRLWAGKGIPPIDYLGPLPPSLSLKVTTLLHTPNSMLPTLAQAQSLLNAGSRLPYALLSIRSLQSSLSTPLLNSASILPPTAGPSNPTLRVLGPTIRASNLSNLSNPNNLNARNAVLNTVTPALTSTPTATDPALAHMPAFVIKFLTDAGYVTPAPAPLALYNRFSALPSTDNAVINLTSDTFITPTKGLSTRGPVSSHLPPSLYPLIGLPAHTPSPGGKGNASFPAQGLDREYKNLQNLPKISCWDPSQMHQLPSPKKWMARFANHCYLYGDWHLPTVLPYFLKGSAVDWYEGLVHKCQLSSEAMSSQWVQERFLQQYNTSMQSDSEIARAKLFKHEISMVHFPNYYNYELAFTDIVQECGNLSMDDQLAWFFHGMTSELLVAVCKQPVTNQPWPSLEAAQAFTRGHILRYSSIPTTPANFGFHSATPAQIMQSSTEIDAARGRPQAHQGPSKIPRRSDPGRGDGGSTWQVSGGGGKGKGRGRGAQFAITAAASPQSVLATMPAAAAPIDKSSAAYILQRNKDLKARISDSFPTTYKDSSTVPLSPRMICMMRLDYHCPRCHENGHMDVDCNNKQLCYKKIATDWPSGHYVGYVKQGITMPSKNARMAADYMGVR